MRRGLVALMTVCVIFAAFAPRAAFADKRVALVVGNNRYEHMPTLDNPVTDARKMREALKKLGFDIVYGEDLDKRALERSIASFAHAATSADVALVFFAGHGATFGDTPYIVPVDAQLASLEAVPYELVALESVVGELRRATGVRIAIVDACRDNAKETALKRVVTRGGEITRGLARVRNPDGLIIAYATQYLATAQDGPASGDSPFTAALLDNIETPGLDVKEMFFKTARDVIAMTNGEQRPELSINFYDSYVLAGAAEEPPKPPQQQQALLTPPQLDKNPTAPRRSDEAIAKGFIINLFERMGQQDDSVLAYLNSVYAPTVDYFGKNLAVASILKEKQAYLKRWPNRQYVPNPESVSTTCNVSQCVVTGTLLWKVSDPQRRLLSAGKALFSFTLDVSGSAPSILSESSKVLSRNSTPTSP